MASSEQRRDAVCVPQNFHGASVLLIGRVLHIRNSNPFCSTNYRYRQKMLLLVDVLLGGKKFAHVWIGGKKRTRNVRVGDVVQLFGRLKLYEHSGEVKWTMHIGYRLVALLRPLPVTEAMYLGWEWRG